MSSLEESYDKMQKFQILKILRAPSIQNHFNAFDNFVTSHDPLFSTIHPHVWSIQFFPRGVKMGVGVKWKMTSILGVRPFLEVSRGLTLPLWSWGVKPPNSHIDHTVPLTHKHTSSLGLQNNHLWFFNEV